MKLIDPSPPRLIDPARSSLHDSGPVGLIRYHVRGCYHPLAASLAAILLLAANPGCSAPPSAAPRASADAVSPTSLTVRGDWNDIVPALEVALTRAEMAILRRTEAGPDRIDYELITIAGDPAFLTVERDPGAGDEGIDLHLRARVGHFGDPQRELNLLTPMQARLRQLAGVDHAPL